MPIDLDSHLDYMPEKDPDSFKVKEEVPAAAQVTPRTEKSDVPTPRVFPKSVDEDVNAVALEKFEDIKESAHLQEVSKMFIPEGKVPAERGNFSRVTKNVDTFRLLAKEGFYQKWIKSVSEFTKKEIEMEREENRLKTYRDKMKDRFLDYLKNVQEKREGNAPPAV